MCLLGFTVDLTTFSSSHDKDPHEFNRCDGYEVTFIQVGVCLKFTNHFIYQHQFTRIILG